METYNQTAFPPFPDLRKESDILKEGHEAYDVYVNEEFVGKKVLLTQSEEIDDIVDFLKTQGVKNVSTNLEGDHFVINSEEPENLKQILKTYLQIR